MKAGSSQISRQILIHILNLPQVFFFYGNPQDEIYKIFNIVYFIIKTAEFRSNTQDPMFCCYSAIWEIILIAVTDKRGQKCKATNDCIAKTYWVQCRTVTPLQMTYIQSRAEEMRHVNCAEGLALCRNASYILVYIGRRVLA